MKKVLLLTLCVLIALPSFALAAGGGLKLCGQVKVFGIFWAPDAKVCWTECDGTPIGGGCITGDKCVYTDGCGKFCFRLTCVCDVFRTCSYVQAVADYGGGVFHVCSEKLCFDFKCGPNQYTIVNGVCLNMGGALI